MRSIFRTKDYDGAAKRYRRPFWLPATNYYMLAAAITIAFFFLVWGILHDGRGEAPWIGAGIAASAMLGGAVFLREVILRRANARFLENQRRLDRSLHQFTAPQTDSPQKLSLEQNSALLKDIRKKSDAAKLLGKFSEGHREVADLCGRYLTINSRELEQINPGSPRLSALLKGREKSRDLHRYHLLQWAEIEARTLAETARSRVKITEKLENAQNALAVIRSALEAYPDELSLQESEQVMMEFVTSIKVSHLVERAERAIFKGDNKQALSLYRDALFYLGRDNIQNEERDTAAARINAEIEKIRGVLAEPPA